MTKGIAGFVATSANSLNIRDAYHDERFDPTTDKKSGYKTKTILAVPIFNPVGEVEGVIQAINKCTDQYGNQQYFDKNDMGLLEMISNLAMSNLRMILKTGVRLFAIRDAKTLTMRGASILKDLFTAETASIFILNREKPKSVFTHGPDGLRKDFEFIGILGDCIAKKQVIAVNNSKNDYRFNGRPA